MLTDSNKISNRNQHHIRIKPFYSIIIHDPDVVELRRGVWNSESHMIKDIEKKGILAQIVLKIKQQISVSDISKEMKINPSTVESVLDHLQQLGVLQSHLTTFLDYYVDHLMTVMKRIRDFNTKIQTMVVLGDSYLNKKLTTHFHHLFSSLEINIDIKNGDAEWNLLENSDDEWLFDALEQEKLIARFKHWQNCFVILSLQFINPTIASKLNRIAKALHFSWIHLALDGPFIFIGPTFQAGQGPCYDCFETRISMNLRESENYQKYKNALAVKQIYHEENDPLLLITSDLLIAHANFEILNYLSTQCSFTTNKVLSIFLPTMEFIYHDVLRLPSCRTCGSMSHRDENQLYFDFQELIGEIA